MLIPGLPPAGTQQEVFKPDRQPRPTGVQALAQDPLADLPVEQQTSGGAGQQGQPEAETHVPNGETDAAEHQSDAAPDTTELPRKGLLVDIRA